MTTCGFMCYGATQTFEIAPIYYYCYCYNYVNNDIFSMIWNTSSTWETHLKSRICAYLCNRLQHIMMYPDQDTGEDGRCACVRQVTSGQWSPAQHQCFGGERRQWLPGTQGTDTGAQSYVTLTVWSSEGLEVQDWLLKLTKWWAQCQCHGILQWPYSDWTTILLTFMWRPHVTYECGSVLDGAFPSHMYEDVMLQETSSQLPWTATSGLESGGHTFTIINSVCSDNCYLTCLYYLDPKGNFQCSHQINCNYCKWLSMNDYEMSTS